MELTAQQLTEELVISPEVMQEALADMDAQLTHEKAFDILFGIVEESEKDIAEHKAEHGNREPIPLTKLCWITRQAFIMGFAHGLDLYNEVVKGFIADFFGGGYKLTLIYYRLLKSVFKPQRGGRLLYV